MEAVLQSVNPACTAFSDAIETFFVAPVMGLATALIIPAIFVFVAYVLTKAITRGR